MSDQITNSIIAWSEIVWSGSNVGTHSQLSSTELQDILASLRFSHSKKEQTLRRLFTDALNACPYPLYRLITDILKQLRGRSGVSYDIQFSPNDYTQLVTGLAKTSNQASPSVQVCLTHDIDTQECAAYWPEVIRIEEAYEVHSTSNVLTKGPYTLDQGWLDELETRGFEIGLHGDTHDMAIGFRNIQAVTDRIRRCLDSLGRPVIGYRAPALGISEPLLKVLPTLGFRYDSSIKTNVYYRGGLDVCIPYLYPETNLWELPLTIQDDGLFRDQMLSEDEALEVIKQTVDILKPYNGLMVFNSHPIHLKSKISFYKNLLAWLTEDAHIEVVLAKDLVNKLDNATMKFRNYENNTANVSL